MPDVDDPQDDDFFDEETVDESLAEEGEEGEEGEDLWEGGDDESILLDEEEDIDS